VLRRIDILGWWIDGSDTGLSLSERGVQSTLAKTFGVSRSTICRDVAWIMERWHLCPCPTCRSPLSVALLERLEKEGQVRIDDPAATTSADRARDEPGGVLATELFLQLAAQQGVISVEGVDALMSTLRGNKELGGARQGRCVSESAR